MLLKQHRGVLVGFEYRLDELFGNTAVYVAVMVHGQDGCKAPGRKRGFLEGLALLAEKTRNVGHEPVRGFHGRGSRGDSLLKKVGAGLFIADEFRACTGNTPGSYEAVLAF